MAIAHTQPALVSPNEVLKSPINDPDPVDHPINCSRIMPDGNIHNNTVCPSWDTDKSHHSPLGISTGQCPSKMRRGWSLKAILTSAGFHGPHDSGCYFFVPKRLSMCPALQSHAKSSDVSTDDSFMQTRHADRRPFVCPFSFPMRANFLRPFLR